MVGPLAKAGMRSLGFEGAALAEKYLTGPATKHLQNAMEHLAPGVNKQIVQTSIISARVAVEEAAGMSSQEAIAAVKPFEKGLVEWGKSAEFVGQTVSAYRNVLNSVVKNASQTAQQTGSSAAKVMAQNPKQYTRMAQQHPQYAEAQRTSEEALKHLKKGSLEMGKGYVKMKANEVKKEVKDTLMDELEAHSREVTAPRRRGMQDFQAEERSALQQNSSESTADAAAELVHEAEGRPKRVVDRETLSRPLVVPTDRKMTEPNAAVLLAQQAAEARVKPLDQQLRNNVQPSQEQDKPEAGRSLVGHKVDDISVLMPAKSVHAQLNR